VKKAGLYQKDLQMSGRVFLSISCPVFWNNLPAGRFNTGLSLILLTAAGDSTVLYSTDLVNFTAVPLP